MYIESKTALRYPEVSVRNRVLWVNPNLNLPFRLTEGQPTDLGVFLVDPNIVHNSRFTLGVDHIHGRTGYVGRFEVADKNGVIYRDFDLKGMGYVKGGYGQDLRVLPVGEKDEGSTYGIWRIEKARREAQITEDLTEREVRTYRIGAIIGLEEIALPDGTKISIEEAKSRGMIHEDEQPVVGLRLYRSRERVRHSLDRFKEIMDDAKKCVSIEFGREINWQEYLTWFSDTLGKNLAEVHNAGYWHGAPDEHNVTLAAEIIDFGLDHGLKDRTFSKRLEDLNLSERDSYIRMDYEMAYDVVRQTARSVQMDPKTHEELIPGTHLGQIYYDAYVKAIKGHKGPAPRPKLLRGENPRSIFGKRVPNLFDKIRGL